MNEDEAEIKSDQDDGGRQELIIPNPSAFIPAFSFASKRGTRRLT